MTIKRKPPLGRLFDLLERDRALFQRPLDRVEPSGGLENVPACFNEAAHVGEVARSVPACEGSVADAEDVRAAGSARVER